MNEMIYQKSYEEYKAELGGELKKAVESFVRIGYLLKVARDTNVLNESGYSSVTEFARAEFGIDKTQVSRFINVNDKYAEGGYSDKLREEYRGSGYAKLTIMLQLPDSLNEELNPSYSKAEIQALKEEMDEENKVSDIERCLESPNRLENNLENLDEHTVLMYKAILQLGEDEPELYVEISKRKNEDLSVVLPEVMAPSGEKMYSIRVRGIGRLMLTMSELSDSIKLINARSGEKYSYTWIDVAAGWAYAGVTGNMLEEQTPIECWEQRYERKYPNVAPVQPQTEVGKQVVPRKESKVVKAKEPVKIKEAKQVVLHDIQPEIPEPDPIEKREEESAINGENTLCEVDSDQQCEGQTSVEDFPEMMPEVIEGEFREIEDAIPNTEEDIREVEADIRESEQETEESKVVSGYKAAVTSNLRTLKNLWEGSNESKIGLMLDVIEDLRWRLEKIKELEDGE